jgi:hypothetical protein
MECTELFGQIEEIDNLFDAQDLQSGILYTLLLG